MQHLKIQLVPLLSNNALEGIDSSRFPAVNLVLEKLPDVLDWIQIGLVGGPVFLGDKRWHIVLEPLDGFL